MDKMRGVRGDKPPCCVVCGNYMTVVVSRKRRATLRCCTNNCGYTEKMKESMCVDEWNGWDEDDWDIVHGDIGSK